MRVAVLGDPIRKDKDLYLVERMKKKFSECLYVPIDRVRFEIRGNMEVCFNTKKLSKFDCIFPIPTYRNKENFYIALRMLSECVMPFTASQYLLLVNGLVYNFLEKEGIPIKKSITITSPDVLDEISKDIKFPLIVKQRGRKVLVTNITTLKHVVSLFRTDFPVKLEFPLRPEKIIYGILINEEVIFCGIRKKRVERKVEKEGRKEVEEMVLKIKSILGLDYFGFKLLKCGSLVLDWISLSPNFKGLERLSKQKICEKIARFMHRRVEMNLFKLKIFKLVRGLLKK